MQPHFNTQPLARWRLSDTLESQNGWCPSDLAGYIIAVLRENTARQLRYNREITSTQATAAPI